MWGSGLRSQCCHCRCPGHCCGMGSFPAMGVAPQKSEGKIRTSSDKNLENLQPVDTLCMNTKRSLQRKKITWTMYSDQKKERKSFREGKIRYFIYLNLT